MRGQGAGDAIRLEAQLFQVLQPSEFRWQWCTELVAAEHERLKACQLTELWRDGPDNGIIAGV